MRKVTLKAKRCKLDANPCNGCVFAVDEIVPCGNEERINDKSNPLFCGEQYEKMRVIWVIE